MLHLEYKKKSKYGKRVLEMPYYRKKNTSVVTIHQPNNEIDVQWVLSLQNKDFFDDCSFLWCPNDQVYWIIDATRIDPDAPV